jgi:hypothetical protein
MASLNPSTDISAFINTIYEGALLVARDNNVMAGIVRVFNDREGLAVRQNSQYGGATINSVAETDDLTGQAFTPASIATLTPAEAAGQYFLTDNRVKSDPFNVRADAATDLGQAMATKIETDLLGCFTSFTGGTVGTAGSTLTLGHMLAMEAQLKAKKAPYPYFFVCHPYQWQPVGKSLGAASTSATNVSEGLKQAVDSMFFVKQIGGIFIFTSANIATITGNDAYVGMWSRDAIALDVRTAPYIEPERDASRRGWELNMSATYGKGVWRPTFGVQGIFDNTAPTS